MYPSTLLAAKLLWLVLFFHGTLETFEAPFLPLIRPIDSLRPFVAEVSLALQLVFFLGGLALLLNVRPRIACAAIGIAIMFLLLGNRSVYRNHVFICGCAFILGAVHRRDEKPWMLVWQIAVLYVFSGLNKLFEADWRSGRFFDAWLGGWVGWYQWCASLFPPRVFGAILAWGTIAFEVTLGFVFLVARARPVAIWLAAGFHIGLYASLAGATFGFFLHNAMILLLAFIPWDLGQTELRAPARWAGILRTLMPWADHDGHIAVRESRDGDWALRVPGVGEMKGWAVLCGTINRLPVVWMALVGAVLVAPWYVPRVAIDVTLAVVLVAGWVAWFPRRAPAPLPAAAASAQSAA